MNVFLVPGGDINSLHKSGTIQWPRGQKSGHICVLRQQLEVRSGIGERDSAVGSAISMPPPKTVSKSQISTEEIVCNVLKIQSNQQLYLLSKLHCKAKIDKL